VSIRPALAALAALSMTTVTMTAGLTGMGSPALAVGVNELPQVTQAELTSSISNIDLRTSDISNVDLQISDIEITDSINDLEQLTQQGNETVVTLTTDILFTFGKDELTPSAGARIVSLVAKVRPAGALTVDGHTDNVGSTGSNLTLSKKRAAAVAAVIAKARPDIKLSVQGLGESKPVASNGTASTDNPAGRAQNRRVELRYQG
jgi:outer membrane protein OmpA-like peptidoglycan-associated protein